MPLVSATEVLREARERVRARNRENQAARAMLDPTRYVAQQESRVHRHNERRDALMYAVDGVDAFGNPTEQEVLNSLRNSYTTAPINGGLNFQGTTTYVRGSSPATTLTNAIAKYLRGRGPEGAEEFRILWFEAIKPSIEDRYEASEIEAQLHI